MVDVHLVGISGSLSKGSFNTALLRAAFEDLSVDVTGEIVSLEPIPMYNWDIERTTGFPASVADLRARVEAADGIVFATPEYNNSVTGALKNAIDWLSRGPSSPLDFKPAAIIGAGGASGTRRSQKHLRDILAYNTLRVLAEPQVLVPTAYSSLEDGRLSDETIRADLALLVKALLFLIESEASSSPPEVRNSIVIAAPDALVADHLDRRIAERGYRTIATATATDAIRLIGSRAVAAVVVDTGLNGSGRSAIIAAAAQHHPQAPIIDVVDRSAVAVELTEALRYQPAAR